MESIYPCEALLPYFLKELDLDAALSFEVHLKACPACLEQLEELQQVWQALPYEMDEVTVPDEMKSQMLDRILDELGLEQDERERDGLESYAPQLEAPITRDAVRAPTPWFRKRWVAAAAAIVLITGAVGGWKWATAVHPVVTVPSPSAGSEQYVLKPFDPAMPTAQGTAWIERKGDVKRLVLKMKGLEGIEGEQAYQLWVIKEGKRYNGGTFRTDANGNALLTYDLQATQGTFEALGITLEPDAHGAQPRGKKVLGT